ncbi:MAG TPA: alpha/beta fold hydrolase [Chitinophagaceae bacterium]|nr:alpha/beta fold hydrolase [Chitinophagaceae bacterium]
MRKKAFKWIRWILLIYALLGIVVYYLQDYFFFQALPVKSSHRYNFSIPYREVNIPYSNNENLNIVQFETNKPIKGVVLYFHGNRKNIGWYAGFAPMFTAQGYEVWMPDYPGYGKSTGKITEEKLYNYALQLYKLAAKRYSADSIIIFGKSMGSGLATYLASNVASKRVILETPYYSLSSVAQHFFPIYPMENMTRVRIPSWEYLQQVSEPVSIFQGTADMIVPYSNAVKLKPFLKPGDEFVTIQKGSHNDLRNFPDFTRKIDSLLKL